MNRGILNLCSKQECIGRGILKLRQVSECSDRSTPNLCSKWE